MAQQISLSDRVNSWLELGRMIQPDKLPASIEAAALRANPWFTSAYIRRALQEFQVWFDEDLIWEFLNQYKIPEASDKLVGIVAAGNLPLVGVHDVVMSVLSGHRTDVKASHQDAVLMQWIVDKWQQILTPLQTRLKLVDKLVKPDFFIGTGSNNTARYLRSHFANIPKILRKSRFSVAFIDRELTDDEWQGLLEDILLYNGTGCRNVSQIVTLTPWDTDRFTGFVEKYPQDQLNPLYLERVLRLGRKMNFLEENFIASEKVLIQRATHFSYTSMGILNLIEVAERQDAERLLEQNRSMIQCCVGKEVPFGKSQSPLFQDFADGIDTMEQLVQI